MLEKKVQIDERDLGATPLSEEELDQLIGKRDYTRFLNPRNELYRERGMKEHPPSRTLTLRLMSQQPNLVRRPILVGVGEPLLGFDEETWKERVR